MAFKKGDGEFKFSIRGMDRVIEEKGNQFTKISQIAWNCSDEDEVPPEKIKVDIRKYFTDPEKGEKMSKGISFLTNEGPHELTHILVEEGFGKTTKILDSIKTRSDFPDAVRESYGENVKDDDSETFDLRDLL